MAERDHHHGLATPKLEGETSVLIVVAPFYRAIADALVAGATAALDAAGCRHEVIEVPGALEIPTAIRLASRARAFDGYVALGCVIRGETSHYDYVCGESARGLMDLSIQKHLPIGYGILTVENEAQAIARADPATRDKGGEAARACLAVLALSKKFTS